MLKALLSELPVSLATDWKCWNMSVCIAGIANSGERLVLVSDKKAAFGDFSADGAVKKDAPLAFGYAIQFAGNDVAHAGAIIRRAKKKLFEIKPDGERLPPDEVAECVYRECQVELGRIQEARVLKKHGYSSQVFRKSGKDICSDSVFFDIHSELEKTKLSLDFLIAGFDQENEAHIRFTNSVTPPHDYDSLGLWAIGKGQHSALSSLSHAIEYLAMSQHADAEMVLYHLLSAKFMAESATDVGKATSTLVLGGKEAPRYLFIDGDDYVRKEWLKSGAPRVPKKLIPEIKALLATGAQLLNGDYLQSITKYSPSAKKIFNIIQARKTTPSTSQKSAGQQ